MGNCSDFLLLFCILPLYSTSNVSSCFLISYFGIVLSLLLLFLKINKLPPQQQHTPANPATPKIIAIINMIITNPINPDPNGQHGIKESAIANTTRNK